MGDETYLAYIVYSPSHGVFLDGLDGGHLPAWSKVNPAMCVGALTFPDGNEGLRIAAATCWPGKLPRDTYFLLCECNRGKRYASMWQCVRAGAEAWFPGCPGEQASPRHWDVFIHSLLPVSVRAPGTRYPFPYERFNLAEACPTYRKP